MCRPILHLRFPPLRTSGEKAVPSYENVRPRHLPGASRTQRLRSTRSVATQPLGGRAPAGDRAVTSLSPQVPDVYFLGTYGFRGRRLRRDGALLRRLRSPICHAASRPWRIRGSVRHHPGKGVKVELSRALLGCRRCGFVVRKYSHIGLAGDCPDCERRLDTRRARGGREIWSAARRRADERRPADAARLEVGVDVDTRVG